MSAASVSRLNHNSHLFHWRKCTSYIQIRFAFAAMILPGFSYDESSFHDSTHDEWNAAHLVTRWQRQPVLTRDRSNFEQPRKPNSSLIIMCRSFKIKHICDQNAFQAKYFESEHKHYRTKVPCCFICPSSRNPCSNRCITYYFIWPCRYTI